MRTRDALASFAAVNATVNNTKGPESPFTAENGRYIKAVMEDWKVPALSIAVIDGNKIFKQGFGIASFPDTAATADTLYYVGSTSKAHAAAALAVLIDTKAKPELLSRGWNTPISSILRDDFILQDEWATNHITLDDAVSHRTGMPAHDFAWRKEKDGLKTNNSLQNVVRNLRNLKLRSEPRVQWEYCNVMYITLSHVIERVTGKWLGQVMKELIWNPLGMKNTYMDLQDAKNAPVKLAKSYRWDKKVNKYQELPFFPAAAASGAGGIISSVSDFAKWLHCLIHETAPFSKTLHEDIKTPRFYANPGSGVPMLYGLGWTRTTLHGATVYWHDGFTGSYGALIYWFPELKYGLVALANAAVTSVYVEQIILQKMMQDKLKVPLADRENLDKKYREVEDSTAREMENAVDILFPKRTAERIPSSVPAKAMVGVYSNPGYGSLKLFQASNPKLTNETILIANRDEAVFEHQLRFHHVSGDYWIIYAATPDNVDGVGYFPGKFHVGIDGKVNAVSIVFNGQSIEDGGTIEFRKME